MADRRPAYPGGASWSVEDIPYESLARDRVVADERLFYVVASASFIEITSDLYTQNLIEYYSQDDELTEWLAHSWEPEELQHGTALRRYVETAWPEFDWEAAYRNFLAEYSQYCRTEQLAPTRALEMAARCVVETGTSTFYRALAKLSPEPVLRRIASAISADEVRHYKHFYYYFRRYAAREQPSRVAILRTLWSRLNEVDAEDAFYAFKHVWLARHPGMAFEKQHYDAFRRSLRDIGKDNFPYAQAVKMLLKLLDLGSTVSRVAVPAVTAASRLLLFR
jgi:rubrerythrin